VVGMILFGAGNINLFLMTPIPVQISCFIISYTKFHFFWKFRILFGKNRFRAILTHYFHVDSINPTAPTQINALWCSKMAVQMIILLCVTTTIVNMDIVRY